METVTVLGGIVQSTGWLGLAGLITIAVLVVILSYYRRLRHIPGPLSACFTDITRMLWVLHNDAHNVHISQHRRYGPLVRFGPNMVSIGDPAEIKHIYGVSGDFQKSDFYRVLSFFVNGKPIPGLFATQDEDVHRALRRPIAGMYAMTSVKQYETFVDRTMEALFVELNRRYADTKEICDLGKWLHYFAFDVIGEITFSKRLGFLDKGDDVEGIMANSWKYFRAQAPVTQMSWVDKVWTKNPVLQRFRKVKINPIVAFARKRRADREISVKVSAEGTDLKDFLTKFLEVESKHSETPPWAVDVWATSNITAGSDTTAILLRTAIYNLLKHPESLKTLRNEVDEHTHPSDFVTWTQALALPYLDACIKEAGRLHPPFALPYERVVPNGGAVICGTFIPEGTIVGISAWVVHRDVATFGDDSDVWRPERWLECDATKRRQMENALLTFGAGHRSCIGKNISYLEAYKLIPTLVKFYNIEFAEEGCPSWRVTNRWFANQSGLKVGISKRNS